VAKIDRGWYLSVHRYTETMGEGKYVWAKAVDKDFAQATLKLVSEMMLANGGPLA